MAGGVANADLLDLIASVQAKYPFSPALDWAQEYHDYDALNVLMTKEKVSIRGGESIKHKIALTESGAAKWTNLYAVDTPSVGNVLDTITVPWRYAQVDYSIERHEMLENMSAEKIVSLVEVRRQDALRDFAGLLQQAFWNPPATTSTDETTPYGIPYWLPQITGAQVTANGGLASNALGAFQGGLPYALSGDAFTTCGDIDPTATGKSRWYSYNDGWDTTDGTVTPDGLVRMRRMFRQCKFTSPRTVDDLGMAGRNLRIYTCETVLSSLEQYVEAKDDNIGADVGKFAEATAFKRIPVQWEEQLDGRTDFVYPLFMVNFNVLKPIILAGDYFREEKPINSRDQHNVFTTFVDLTLNFLCRNRQRVGGVLTYVAAA